MEEFIREIKALSTEDISLILSDQRDLYTGDEIRLLEEELLRRNCPDKRVSQLQHEITNRNLSNRLNRLIVSTGPTIDGFKIERYIDVVFVEKITGIGLKTSLKSIADIFASLSGDEMTAVTERICSLKQQSFLELKEKAVRLGANALIGVDFETTLPGGSAIMVSVSGTAVVINQK